MRSDIRAAARLATSVGFALLSAAGPASADEPERFPLAPGATYEAPAGNVVPNGNFEGDWHETPVGALADGWQPFNLLEGMGFGRATGVRGSAQAIAGDFCGVWREVPVEPDRKYRLTVWVACAGERLTEPRFGWEPEGRGWFCQRCRRFGLPRTIIWTEPEPPESGAWPGRTWHQFSAEVNTTGPRITLWLNPGGDGELRVDEVSLVDIGAADPAAAPRAPTQRVRRLVNGGFEGPWQETPVGMVAEGWGIFNTTAAYRFAREPGVTGWGASGRVGGAVRDLPSRQGAARPQVSPLLFRQGYRRQSDGALWLGPRGRRLALPLLRRVRLSAHHPLGRAVGALVGR